MREAKRKPYYGLIGNGETAALIHPTGAVHWMCMPRFDGFPVFAKALDPNHGGYLQLIFPEELQLSRQAYRLQTAVLESAVQTAHWQITFVDAMPWGSHGIVREIHITNLSDSAGAFSVRWEFKPTQTRVHPYSYFEEENRILVRDEDGFMIISWEQPGTEWNPGETKTVRAYLAYGESEWEAEEALAELQAKNIAETEDFWRTWLNKGKKLPGLSQHEQEMYERSLMVLKMLCYEKTGAILAAPTASFPAVPHGGDNWDYRYLWLRDGYYVAYAFDMAGFHEEAEAFYRFAFALQSPDGSWKQPLYTIDGGLPKEFIVPDLSGPNGEKPVRFGNLAAEQLQLDNNGNIVHGFWYHYTRTGNKELLKLYWLNIKAACEWVIANWNQPENGIWEIRERKDHWIHGKTMCYACLDAGAKLAEEMGEHALAEMWRKEAEQIKKSILENGWNKERQAYLQSYSPDAPLDISVLALEFYGIHDATDERMRKTVELMEQPLKRPEIEVKEYTTASPFAQLGYRVLGGLNLNGGIARYDYAHVPFYLPTLWLAKHYLAAGNRQRAQELVDVCFNCSTELLLMAEHFDPVTGEQWGNFPQAFSHEEMVQVLILLNQAQK